jgi:hypothetical protein
LATAHVKNGIKLSEYSSQTYFSASLAIQCNILQNGLYLYLLKISLTECWCS